VQEGDVAARALDAERGAVVERIGDLRSDLEQLIQASVSDNADDEHDPEGATIAFERAQLASVLAAAEQRLIDIDHTIATVAAGTYGRCEVCGRPISAERLAARPSATTCVACASR
jgi:DnaK suppressor protein